MPPRSARPHRPRATGRWVRDSPAALPHHRATGRHPSPESSRTERNLRFCPALWSAGASPLFAGVFARFEILNRTPENRGVPVLTCESGRGRPLARWARSRRLGAHLPHRHLRVASLRPRAGSVARPRWTGITMRARGAPDLQDRAGPFVSAGAQRICALRCVCTRFRLLVSFDIV
jgi:hypothetical protein